MPALINQLEGKVVLESGVAETASVFVDQESPLLTRSCKVCNGSPLLVTEDPVTGANLVLTCKPREPLRPERDENFRTLPDSHPSYEIKWSVNSPSVEIHEHWCVPEPKAIKLRHQNVFARTLLPRHRDSAGYFHLLNHRLEVLEAVRLFLD